MRKSNLTNSQKESLTNGFRFIFVDKNGTKQFAACGLTVSKIASAKNQFLLGKIARIGTVEVTEEGAKVGVKLANFTLLDEVKKLPKVEKELSYNQLKDFCNAHNIELWPSQNKVKKAVIKSVNIDW